MESTSAIEIIAEQSEQNQFAVYGENIKINFGSKSTPNPILNNLSILIPKGCIYGLIGPSGCGKTTLQRTIIGMLRPDSGLLKVFNQIPRSKGSSVPGSMIGYMPQEIALDDELTVTEQLTFLGRVAGLSSETIKSQHHEILSIMSIDDPSRQSKYFSTGQRRRISLACSLIHSPKLLLLDEPTVGSDIVLVYKIWTYLRKLNETQGTTVVITTHYLEEVTRADYFGFMANGQIKFQGRPQSFMESVGAITFEQAILIKYNSEKQSNNNESPDETKCNQIEQLTTPNAPSKVFSSSVSKSKVNGLQLVLLLMWRYLLRWKVILLLPYLVLVSSVIFIGYFMVYFFGSPMVDLTVAYVNLTNSSIYISNLTEHLVSHDIQLVHVTDEIIARRMVETGQAVAYFIVPEEFDLGLETRVASALSSTADEALQLAGRITMYQDNSHAIISSTIKKKLYEALDDIMDSIVQSKGLNGNRLEFIRIIGVIERTDDSDKLVSIPLFLLRLLTYFLESYSMILFTYWTVKEAHEPMNERLASLAIKPNHLRITATILATLALTPAFYANYALFIKLFDIPSKGQLIMTLPIIIGCIICGICKAILLGSLIDSDVTCFILNLFYSGITWAYGCIAWPYESVMYFIQPLTLLVPCLVPSEAIIRIIMYGDGISHPTVYTGYLYTIIMAILHMIMVLITNRQK